MLYNISFQIQKQIDIPEETDQDTDEASAVTKETKALEAAGWNVDLDSLEPLDDEDDEDDEEEDDGEGNGGDEPTGGGEL